MRSRFTRALVGLTAAVALGGSPVAAVALASPQHAPKHAPHARHVNHARQASDPAASERSSESSVESASEPENDASQQAATCQSAGVDHNGSNVQYDGQTCSASGGGGGGDQTQQ
jgi:hypothetical protein